MSPSAISSSSTICVERRSRNPTYYHWETKVVRKTRLEKIPWREVVFFFVPQSILFDSSTLGQTEAKGLSEAQMYPFG